MGEKDTDTPIGGAPEPDGMGAAGGEGGQDDTSQPIEPGEPSDLAQPADDAHGSPVSGEAVDVGYSQQDIDALISGSGMPAGGQNAESSQDPAADEPSVGVDSEGRPQDEYGAAMAAAIAEEKEAGAGIPTTDLPATEVELPTFDREDVASEVTQPISLLHDVQLHVKIELGRTNMFVEDVLRLGEGSVVELDRLAGDPVDVYVNGRLVARGEVLVLNDNFCVRVSEIISESNVRVAV